MQLQAMRGHTVRTPLCSDIALLDKSYIHIRENICFHTHPIADDRRMNVKDQSNAHDVHVDMCGAV